MDVLQDKDRGTAELEKELRAWAATMRETVDDLVDKAAVGLLTETIKEEEQIQSSE